MSLYQGDDRTPQEKDAFKLMLPNVNLLYMGATVLVLLDRLFMTRFWTLFESWLAFSMPTADRGLVAATGDKRRGVIVSLDQSCDAGALERLWADSSATVAHSKLSSD